jgi:hypothetical protein
MRELGRHGPQRELCADAAPLQYCSIVAEEYVGVNPHVNRGTEEELNPSRAAFARHASAREECVPLLPGM